MRKKFCMLFARDQLVAYSWYIVVIFQAKYGAYLFLKPFVYLAKCFHYLICLFTNNDLSTNVRLASKVRIHHAFGIVVGSGTIIGKGVLLRSGCVLGESKTGKCDAPNLSDGVELGPNAVILGDIIIEPNVKIKPCSVIIK